MVFTLRPSAHLRPLATLAGLGTMSRNSDIVRFVQGGVVKTFRCADSPTPMSEPPVCESCGSHRVRIRWGSACYSPTDVDDPDVQSGVMILGNTIDRDRNPPGFVCTSCEPRWLDVHKLVVRDCQLQTAKENAIEAQDFNKAPPDA